MGGGDHLHLPARLLQDIGQDAGGGGVERALRLLDPHDLRNADGFAVTLKEGDQHAQGAERSVRHAAREEPPGVGIAADALQELERQLRTDDPTLHPDGLRRHLRQVLRDPVGGGHRLRLQSSDDAGDVSALAVEQIARVGGLQFTDPLRIQVVEPHPGQDVVHRPEHGVRRSRQEVQPVPSRDRGRMGDRAAYDLPSLDQEFFRLRRGGRANPTGLPAGGIAALRTGADLEGIGSEAPFEAQVEADAEVVRVAAGAAPDLTDPAAFAKRVVQREAERLRDKTQGVEKVALPAPVGADEERERPEPDIAGADALVVPQRHPRDRRGIAPAHRMAAAGAARAHRNRRAARGRERRARRKTVRRPSRA